MLELLALESKVGWCVEWIVQVRGILREIIR